jgi:hypothetical protein
MSGRDEVGLARGCVAERSVKDRRAPVHGRATASLLTLLCVGLCIGARACGFSSRFKSSPASSSGSSGISAPSRSGSGVPRAGHVLPKKAVERITQTFNGQLRAADIAFATPTKLRVGDNGIVDLQLSLTLPVSALRARLAAAGAPSGGQILASNTMEAALTGIGFKIEDITAAGQAVGSGATEWKWEIAPTMAGRLTLHLAMTAFVVLNGTRAEYGVRTTTGRCRCKAFRSPGRPGSRTFSPVTGRGWLECCHSSRAGSDGYCAPAGTSDQSPNASNPRAGARSRVTRNPDRIVRRNLRAVGRRAGGECHASRGATRRSPRDEVRSGPSTRREIPRRPSSRHRRETGAFPSSALQPRHLPGRRRRL